MFMTYDASEDATIAGRRVAIVCIVLGDLLL